jgi:hypothetical protein
VEDDMLHEDFLRRYRAAHTELIDADPGFATWLDRHYAPIAGGWMY